MDQIIQNILEIFNLLSRLLHSFVSLEENSDVVSTVEATSVACCDYRSEISSIELKIGNVWQIYFDCKNVFEYFILEYNRLACRNRIFVRSYCFRFVCHCAHPRHSIHQFRRRLIILFFWGSHEQLVHEWRTLTECI